MLLAGVLFNVQANAEDGNITPNAIEVLGDANLYPSANPNGTTPSSACVNNAFSPTPAADGTIDWVLDCLVNNALVPGTSSAAGGKGHWAGFRVLDGIAGNDQDIFLTGGKENDTSTWNPGPGTIGSSKYDATQAYLANNTTDAFLAMERRGNNGTTAFDWEFNKLAPIDPTPNNTSDPLYIPNRSECDVLVAYEMKGSGSSGSADPFLFRWNDPDVAGAPACNPDPTNPPADTNHNGAWAAVPITGVDAVINNSPTPSGPWGTVDSKGVWTLDAIDKFQFAESRVPLSKLGITPGDECEAVSRFVQVRTRSAVSDTSDLKDLTKIFEFEFFEPENPTQTQSEICGASFTFGQTNVPQTNAAPDWLFDVPSSAGVTLSGENNLSLSDQGTANNKHTWKANDVYSGQVHVDFSQSQLDQVTIGITQQAADGTCDTSSTGSIVVHRELGITGSLTPDCGNVFSYSASSTGGVGPKTYAWSFEKETAPNVWTAVASSNLQNGSIDMDSVQNGGQGKYRGVVTVTDSADPSTGKLACTATVTTNAVNVYDDVLASATLTPDCDGTFAWTAGATGGKAPYDFDVQIQKLVSGNWTNVGTLIEVDNDADGAINGVYDATGSPGRYRVHVDVADDQAVPCTDDANSNEADIRDALTATSVKHAGTTVRNTNTAGLDGSHTGSIQGDVVSYQWQVRPIQGGAWTNLAGKTTEDITYNGFKTDQTSPADVDFTVAGDNYLGRVWEVELRLRVFRTLNGQLCEVFSTPVDVSIIEGVDP